MKVFTRIIIFVLVAKIVLAAGKDLPQTFMKCKRDDQKCLVAAVTDALQQTKSDGLPEFGIFSIDPLVVDSLIISQGSNSPVNLRQEFKKIKIYNISDSTINQVLVDLDKYRIKMIIDAPRLEMIGDYVMNGQILVLPITGGGKSNITLTGLVATHELVGEPYKQNDEIYFRVKEYKLKLKPKRVYLDFDNLFNGDKTLADTMNKFLNENWEVVFNELKGGYQDSFGLIFKEISNKFLLKVPINKIFLD